MAVLLRHRTAGGHILGGSPPVGGGGRFNDLVFNKTVGIGGDYVDARVPLRGGTYYMDPFDLTPGNGYHRNNDPTKPNNNWLEFYEYDGPGTVTFDLRPESAAATLGQTQTQAYNDLTTGGGMRANGSGSFRWIFNGAFKFYDGGIHLNLNQDRCYWFGKGKRRFGILEWRRQYDIVAGLQLKNTVGVNLDNTAYFQNVWNDPRMKGNTVNHFNFCCGWRLEGAARIKVIGYDVGPIGDDGMFAGSGSNFVDVIGTVIHEVDNTRDSYTAGGVFQGLMVNDTMHNDCVQLTGANDTLRVLDSTLQGHGLEMFTDNGSMTNCILDRVQQGMSGSGGGDIGTGAFSINNTNLIGQGGPSGTRLGNVHYYRGFSNGMGTHDHVAQVAVSPVSTFHAVLEDFGGTTVDLSKVTVAVPTGVVVDGDGFANPNDLTAFLASVGAPHNAFWAAYATTEMTTVFNHYGIPLD